MAKTQFNQNLEQRVPLENGDELIVVFRRLSFVEKAQAAATMQTAGDVPALIGYAKTIASAITGATLASGAKLEAVGLAGDWADIGGVFWSGIDAATAVDWFLALIAHGRLTAQEKKESGILPSG